MYILYALVMYFDMYILGLVFLVWLKLYLKSNVMVLMVKNKDKRSYKFASRISKICKLSLGLLG